MDEAVAFFENWLKEKQRVSGLLYTAPLDKYNKEVEKLDKLFEMKGASHMKQAVEPSDDAKAKRKRRTENGVSEPVLMLVRRYEHPDFAALYRGYLSGAFYPDETPSYSSSEFIAPRKGGLKFVSHYLLCPECMMTGEIEGKTCPECKGLGWQHINGVNLDDPGRVVDVRRIREPGRKTDMLDYKSAEGYPKPGRKKK